jgi:processive rubber oxygenase RoxA-like protein
MFHAAGRFDVMVAHRTTVGPPARKQPSERGIGMWPRSGFWSAAFFGVTIGAAAPVAAQPVDLDQGWNAAEHAAWESVTQGSRLMPLAWFLALEQPGNATSFLEPANVERFRLLPRDPAAGNPLPVGFVEDVRDDDKLSVTKLRWKSNQTATEKWVGLNCSACHTAELTYKNRAIHVDGAPTLSDFQTFFEDLATALAETRDDATKFGRFARKVLGQSTADAAKLKAALSQLVAFQADLQKMNHTPLRYGYGRLDAVGFIFNKVSRVANGNAESGNPSDAPVSYPFIWNVPQHDRVQWNGIARNKAIAGIGEQPFDIGALGRNTGEVIGVFADIKPKADPGLKGFTSSVDVPRLVAIEQQLGRLRPPKWPSDVFGALDANRVAAGKALFVEHCAACHAHLDRTDLKTPIRAELTRLRDPLHPERSIGTDPWMACNAYTLRAKSGVLRGMKTQYFSGDVMGDRAFLSELLTVEITGALLGQKGDVVKTAAASFFGVMRPLTAVAASAGERLEKCMTDQVDILAYKGRPLTGIWATAPYLHNGSVPTLDDLLLAPDRRPKSFFVGSREYDPIKVGYVTAQSADNSFELKTHDAAGKPIAGNSNLGHDYGNASFDDEERRNLVEYMKSL